MEERLRHLNNAIPHRDVIQGLADKFTASPARCGKIPVQPKQVGFVSPHPTPVAEEDPSNSNLIDCAPLSVSFLGRGYYEIWARLIPICVDLRLGAGLELVPEPEVLAAVQDHQGLAAAAGQDAAHGGRGAPPGFL